jgi:hypothetical protein
MKMKLKKKLAQCQRELVVWAFVEGGRIYRSRPWSVVVGDEVYGFQTRAEAKAFARSINNAA